MRPRHSSEPRRFGDMCVLQQISYSLLDCILLPSPAAARAQRARPPDHGACSASGGRAARPVPARRGGSVRWWRVSPWRDCPVPRPRQDSGSVLWLPAGRKEVGIRRLSSSPRPRPDAGPAAQQFASWPALTSRCPGHRPFRAPLSACRGPQFSRGGRIFRGPARPGSEGHAALRQSSQKRGQQPPGPPPSMSYSITTPTPRSPASSTTAA